MVKFSEVYRMLEAAGWKRQGGTKHFKYVHPDHDFYVLVGRHPSQEVATGTLNQIMKKAGLKDKKK